MIKEGEKMIGFTAASNYSFFICIWMAISQFKNDQKCIVLYDEIKDIDHIGNKLKELKIFDVVKVIHVNRNTQIGNWKRRYHMFFINKEIQEICELYRFHKFIFFTNDSLNIPFIISKVYKKNPDCEFAFGEEGIGVYYNKEAYLPTPRIDFWLSLLRRKKYLRMLKVLYVREPSLLTYPSNLDVRKIAPCVDTEKLHQIINALWKYQSLPDMPLFLMQQPFSEDDKNQIGIDENANLLFNRICERFPGLTALKLHPRTRNYILPKNAFVIDKNIQFENSLNNSINQKTIISINSTASFSPYLLWGYTPNIILLYKLFNWGENQQSRFGKLDKFLTNFSTLYAKRGGKIFVPQNESELFRILDRVMNRGKNE